MADKTDIQVEALEVFTNQVLYLRQVYPQQLFKKRVYCNTPVFVAQYPPLNSYIGNVLRVARQLLQSGALESAKLVLYVNEGTVIEEYKFQFDRKLNSKLITNEISQYGSNESDANCLVIEEQLRATFYKLAGRLKSLKPLPNESKFKVLLYTSRAAFVEFSNASHHQEFPWLEETVIATGSAETMNTATAAQLPLAMLDRIGLQINAIICNA